MLFEDEEYAKAIAVMAKDSVIGTAPGWDEACGLVANAMDRAEICIKDKDAIHQVLPNLCKWCAGHPEHLDLPMVYSFAFTLWMRYSDLAGAEAALELMHTIPEADQKPFEALSDVFQTQKNPSHLHRLAPERARFVTELLAKQPASARKREKPIKS